MHSRMNKKRYTDLFIDFDDTIYNTHGNAEVALEELYDYLELNKYFDSLEDFTIPYWSANIELWGQYSRGEIERDYLIIERFRRPLSLGKGLKVDKEYCLKTSDKFLDLCSVKSGLVDGARELMEYLYGKYRLHLCSNGFHEVQYKKLHASDTFRYFDTIILSEDAGVNKPNPAFFEYALQKTGASRENTLMIGDNYNTDIKGAQSAKIDQLYFNRWNDPEAHPEVTLQVEKLTDIIKML